MSLNAGGMRSDIKRKKVWRYINSHSADIGFLQETHSCQKDNSLWSNESGMKCLFANGSSQTCGVAIVFKKYGDKIQEVVRDLNDRYLLVKMYIGDYTYCLVNIYS